MAELIELSKIRKDGGTQPRAFVEMEVVHDYAEAMKNGAEFPAIDVFYDGQDYWLADGFHRLAAAKQAGLDCIRAEPHQGTQRDAILYSVGANATHGLRRSNADKRRAVETLLRDEEWAKWSDREIARRAGVSAPMVGQVREALARTINHLQSAERTGADGRTINTTKIGSNPETLYLVTPSDDPDIERARQIALAVVGGSKVELESSIRGHSGTGNGEYATQLGGGEVFLDFKKPTARRERYARDQVAITFKSEDGDRLFRFNAYQLLQWKLALAEEQSSPVDCEFEAGQQVVIWAKCSRYSLGTDGLYFTTRFADTIDAGDKYLFVKAFQQGNHLFAMIERYYKSVVPLSAIRAEEVEQQPAAPQDQPKAEEPVHPALLTPVPPGGHYMCSNEEARLGGRGATVKLPNGGTGTLAFCSGNIAFVDTANGRKQYREYYLEPVENSVATETRNGFMVGDWVSKALADHVLVGQVVGFDDEKLVVNTDKGTAHLYPDGMTLLAEPPVSVDAPVATETIPQDDQPESREPQLREIFSIYYESEDIIELLPSLVALLEYAEGNRDSSPDLAEDIRRVVLWADGMDEVLREELSAENTLASQEA